MIYKNIFNFKKTNDYSLLSLFDVHINIEKFNQLYYTIKYKVGFI